MAVAGWEERSDFAIRIHRRYNTPCFSGIKELFSISGFTSFANANEGRKIARSEMMTRNNAIFLMIYSSSNLMA